jgi:hypothetical protein
MRSFIAIAALCAAFAGYPAFAEDASSQQPTRIEINQQTKTFTFIADDKPVAILDKDGLIVRAGIVYGENLTDAGADYFDKKIESFSKEAADD